MNRYRKSKKAQIELTFNWIYILIAGAVIMLFFVGIVVKQKTVSEEKLSGEVVRILESILAGAGVSEKTKNPIYMGGLADYTFYFECENEVSNFGIKGKPAKAENSIDPVFAPKEIKTTKMLLWSLPYKLPFKVMDFLIVSSSNNKYYLVGNDADFVEEFMNLTDGFNREYLFNLDEISAKGESLQVRVIDVDGTNVPAKGIPEALINFDDDKVSAIVFTGKSQVDFYQKKGSSWSKLNKNPVRIISIGGERDAAKYAAIFSGDDQTYQCNMKKAFKRLTILTEVYGGEGIGQLEIGGKLKEIVDYYQERPELSLSNDCLNQLTVYDNNVMNLLGDLKSTASACELDEDSCVELMNIANDLKKVNNDLRLNCIKLY
ncbi:MAG: hypothetical protein ABH824_03965 [Nanoarchaeota archaeon]|nr:hypothetical protein [Nanoarchaeota archaeon]MBU1632558.1 hypothetical protein [Nanoarchaeota archaeon]MBU1876577.1 hypothetical protein [Nanoarchaeota archaeon]